MALTFSHSLSQLPLSHQNQLFAPQFQRILTAKTSIDFLKFSSIRCSAKRNDKSTSTFKTCKNCKTQFDPTLNHPRACRFHTAHFGGETRRKFESVYTGGTMSTPESGKVFQYWHCCGSEDPFDLGCTAAPHLSYDD
ncbi:Carboxypeptidase [Quillaja saponaria]|uniref:Carboxypeptidase n=1 Tax=Quillaja saponaria TaxID=32244 RepID=A0AAD7Q7D3_QUISA|nr:Carboxypeptidase [Quillaja saponaria]